MLFQRARAVVDLLRAISDVHLLGEHHGRVLDDGQRFERGAALALRLQRQPQVSLSRAEMLPHVQRGTAGHLTEYRVQRHGLRVEHSLGNRQVATVHGLPLFLKALNHVGEGEPASYEETVVDMIKADPEFAAVYLAAALEEVEQPGGQTALLAVLRHIAEAQGMASVAERAGIPRESLYRALSPRGNPTLKTLLALLNATGLRLGVQG